MSTHQTWLSDAHYQALKERDEALEERDEALEALANGAPAPGVTFIVPCFEQSEWLPECLTSLVGQTVKPYEIIVIDDGSNDDEADRIRAICEEFGAVRTRITNRGLPGARNTGLMMSRTFAVCPVDADDWLREDYIELTLPLLAEADVVLTGLQEHGPTRNGRYDAGYDRPWHEVTEEVMWQYNRFFYAALWRRDTLAYMGGYHPAMAGWPGVSGGYEDWTTWIDAMRRGLRFAAVDEPLLNYRTRADSMLAKAERNRAALVGEIKRHHRHS